LDAVPAAIASPLLDLLTSGGLSILVLLPVVLVPHAPLSTSAGALLLVLALLVNWPHFMASYRLLYFSRQSAAAHPIASYYFPAALALFALVGLLQARTHPALLNLLLTTSAVYLARHYTGQAWGLMASFLYARGLFATETERSRIRLSLDLLMLWHISWALTQTIGLTLPALVQPIRELHGYMTWVAVASLAIGGLGIGAMARRLGRTLPLQVLLPWLALYFWYAALARDPSAIGIVQLAHSLQYMIVPLRIQLNRRARGAESSGPAWRFVAGSWTSWIIVGVAVFIGVRALFAVCFHSAGGQSIMADLVGTAVTSCVNIHHYFIDGALYKLRNPEVRRDLLAHIQPMVRGTSGPQRVGAR
jgi:hypothetical protein